MNGIAGFGKPPVASKIAIKSRSELKNVNWRLQVVLLVAFCFLLLAHGSAEAQTAKRLVLKDGSYQLASKWEVSGDRVRYLSTERNEWEEIPASMIDWPSTENFEKQRVSQRKLEFKQSEEDDESDAKVAAGPAIGFGLHLPNSGGVYLLDTYNGEPRLTELSQNSGEINRQPSRSRQILRGAIGPLAAQKQSIDLKGEHASTQAHAQQPVIYIDIEEDPGAKPMPLAERFRIARLEPGKNGRVVGSLTVTITGKASLRELYLPATAEQLPGGWVKLIPSEPLSPGEYALVEVLGPKTINSFVWDFGVDPSAPENPAAGRATPQPSLPADAATPHDLQNRPQ
jgi:hypothetical protein